MTSTGPMSRELRAIASLWYDEEIADSEVTNRVARVMSPAGWPGPPLQNVVLALGRHLQDWDVQRQDAFIAICIMAEPRLSPHLENMCAALRPTPPSA